MAVTQEDVALRAGVSRPLVSLVMRNSPHVSDQKREAVLRAANELGYRRNTHAAQLASHKSMILGVILAEVANPIYLPTLRAAEDRAEEQGYGVIVAVGSLQPEIERRAVDRLLGHRVDGIVLAGTLLPAGEVRALADALPVVAVGRRIAGIETVAVDDRAGAEVAVQHLIDHGHRRIAHIDGGTGPGARIRRRSYADTMTRNHLAGLVSIASGDYTEAGGASAAERLLTSPNPPTAVFAANDLMAVGVLGAAYRLGIRVPERLSVVGFDNSPMSAFDLIQLTTVRQAPDELGAKGVDALVHLIGEPGASTRTTLLKPELEIRRSTAPFVA